MWLAAQEGRSREKEVCRKRRLWRIAAAWVVCVCRGVLNNTTLALRACESAERGMPWAGPKLWAASARRMWW